MTGRLTVVVVTHNSAHLLPDLIASIPAAMGDLCWELVVVDNDSVDGVAETLERLLPEARLLTTGSNAGYSAGINTGHAAAARPDALLVLNPDVRLGPRCAELLFDAAVGQQRGIAVPRLIDEEGRLIESLRRRPSVLRSWAGAVLGTRRAGRIGLLGEVVTTPQAYTRAGLTDWAEGSTQVISAQCWQRVGGWDESFFLYSEETDYHLRAAEAGFGVWFVPEAEATHLEGGSANPRLWTLLVLNRIKLFARGHGRAAVAGFWAASVWHEAVRAVGGRPASRAALAALLDLRRVGAVLRAREPARVREIIGLA